VSVFGYALNQRSYSPALNFNDVPDADNLNVRGTLTVPLYAGGRISAAREAARAGTAAARAEAEVVAQKLEYEVARTFYTVQKTRRLIEAASTTVRSFELNRAVAEKRLNAGSALKTELLDIDVRLSESREELVRARNASALAATALRTLLGIESGSIEVNEDPIEVDLPVISQPASHPELLALAFHENAAESEVRKARSGYRPKVEAFGNVDHDTGWRFNQSRNSGNSYAVGVVARWDLWDGHLTRSRVQEAESRLALVREQERSLRLQIRYEVEHAQQQIDETNERLSVVRRTIVQAEESVVLTRARFEQGLALSTQLIDAETALTEAKMREVEAEADRRIAIAALRKAQGLSQLEGIKP
jgi:outer membrane protein TolC